jgi:putative redox protein
MNVEVCFPSAERVQAACKGMVLETGMPPDKGGDPGDVGSFDILLSALATCTGFQVLMFLRERGLSYEDARLSLKGHRSEETHLLDTVTVDIKLPADFPEKYYDAVVRATGQCYIKAQLGQKPQFEVSVHT